jgi:hypothetical protein
MSPTAIELVEFTRTDPAGVLARMDDLGRDLSGWVNFQPNVDPEDVPGSGFNLLSVFSARGPAIPLATWMPGRRTRKGATTPAEVGIQHPAGSQAVPVLRNRSVEIPTGWVVLQDNPKRGLVLRLPPDAPHAATLNWLLDATAALCAYPLPDSWLAAVYGGEPPSP